MIKIENYEVLTARYANESKTEVFMETRNYGSVLETNKWAGWDKLISKLNVSDYVEPIITEQE